MEELLANVETVVAPIVLKLVSSGLSALSPRERRSLIFFVACAYARTPQTRRTIVRGIEKLGVSKLKDFVEDEPKFRASLVRYNAVKGEALKEEDARRFIGTVLSGDATLRLKDKARIGFPLLTIVPLCSMFLSMHWRLLHAPLGKEFVTSDNPVIIAGPARASETRDLEITMPLDPQHCLLLTWGGPSEDVIAYSDQGWADDVVRRTTVGADREVYAPHKNPVVARNLP